MLGRELIHRRLWGRSLGGLLAAVGLLFPAAYCWWRAYLIGFPANKAVGTPYYAEYLARGQYEEMLWKIITLALLVASAILLGVGVQRKTGGDLLAWADERWERWIGPLRRFLGRLVLLAFVMHIITILGILICELWG